MRSRGTSFSTMVFACVALSGCVGSSAGTGSTGLDDAPKPEAPVIAEQATTTLAPARNVDLVNVDPVRAALASLQKSDLRLGTLLEPQEGLGIEACSAAAVPHVLTRERLHEIVTDEGLLDVAELTLGERKALGQAIGPCHQDTDLLHRLVAVQDFQVADCIVDKLVDLDHVPSVVAALLADTSIESTSSVVGFRAECQALELDEWFGSPPGGSAGAYAELISESLVRELVPRFSRTQFEWACLRRATAVSMPTNWAQEVVDQRGGNPLSALDFLLTSTDPVVRQDIITAVKSGVIRCIEPVALFVERTGVSDVATASQLGCLRDGLPQESVVMLNSEMFEGLTSEQHQGDPMPEEIASVFFNCGLEPPVL